MKTIGDLVSTDNAYVFLSTQGSSCDATEIVFVKTIQTTFTFQGHSVDTFEAVDSLAKINALGSPSISTFLESRQIFALPPFVGAKFTDFAEAPCPLDYLLIISKALLKYESSHDGSNLYSVHLPSMTFLLATINISLYRFELNIQRRREGLDLFLLLGVAKEGATPPWDSRKHVIHHICCRYFNCILSVLLSLGLGLNQTYNGIYRDTSDHHLIFTISLTVL
jgi:hypothetical protein